MGLRASAGIYEVFGQSRLLSHDLAVFPDINRRAVHAGGLAGDPRGPAQRPSDGGRKLCGFCFFLFHGPFSIRRGLSAELSYTAHTLASGRTNGKFSHERSQGTRKRRTTAENRFPLLCSFVAIHFLSSRMGKFSHERSQRTRKRRTTAQLLKIGSLYCVLTCSFVAILAPNPFRFGCALVIQNKFLDLKFVTAEIDQQPVFNASRLHVPQNLCRVFMGQRSARF